MISDIDTDTDIHIDTDRDIDIDIPTDIVRGIGVATATLIGKPSASFTPMSTDDIQPLLLIDSLPDDVFKNADISKDIVTDIISHFCTAYRKNKHKPCPHISEEFAKRIPERIAVLIDPDSGEYLIDEEDWKSSPEFYTKWYQDMIDKYFSTEFSEGCNYSLQHFFSGNIRVLRWYESGRQPYEYE